MKITEIQMKIIAIGLLPIFIVITFILPDSTGKNILLWGILLAAIAASLIGWKLQKKEANPEDDLLAMPPKRT